MFQRCQCLSFWTNSWKQWWLSRTNPLLLPWLKIYTFFLTTMVTGICWLMKAFLPVICHKRFQIVGCYTWWCRSPIADPKAKGVIYGLTLDTSEKQLALLYLATVQGIAYGTRHIVEHCNAHGHKVRMYNAITHIWGY